MVDMKSIETYLGNIVLEILANEDTKELMLNPDGKLYVETFSKGIELTTISLDDGHITNLIKLLAHHEGGVINAQNPHLMSRLPMRGERFQAMLPPIVDRATFSIRTPATRVFKLSEYFTLDASQVEKRKQKKELNYRLKNEYDTYIKNLLKFEDIEGFLELACQQYKNIFITGSTGSGKTTFMNALLDSEYIKKSRCYIMQDTSELQVNAPNKVECKWDYHTTPQDLIKIALRMRPDRAMIGEVRGQECLDLLTLWNTGHSGGIATAHANSAEDALTRIEDMLLQHPNITSVPYNTIASAIDLIVHLENTEVIQIVSVKGRSAENYDTTLLYEL